MRYTSKAELLAAIRDEHARLVDRIDEVPAELREEPGVWGDGWTVADLLAHLSEWHRMFLGWYRDGAGGREPTMPAPGYQWNETPRLNRAIQAKHEGRPWEDVRAEFEGSHAEIVELVEHLSEEQLLDAGHFSWTGRYPLTTYLGPNTASHYRFAIKVLKRWRRLRDRTP